MTKSELIEALKEVPDDILVIPSSKSNNDIYEVLSVMNLGDGVVYLELGK